MKNLLFIFFLLTGYVHADGIDGTFVPPTQREDGTVLTQAEIANYEVYLNDVASLTVPAGATTFTLTLDPGTYSLYMTTVDTDGRISLPSNVVSVTAKSPPGNPANLIIKIRKN